MTLNMMSKILFNRGLCQFDSNYGEVKSCISNNEKVYIYASYEPTKPYININDLIFFQYIHALQKDLEIPVIIQILDNHTLLQDISIDDFEDLSVFKEDAMTGLKGYSKEKVENISKMQNKVLKKFLSEKSGIIKDVYKQTAVRILTETVMKCLITIGFESDNTFIFSSLDYLSQGGGYYETIIKFGSKLTIKDGCKNEECDYSDNIELLSLINKDISGIFPQSFTKLFGGSRRIKPLIVRRHEDDHKVLLSRKIAHTLELYKPSSIIIDDLIGLHGNGKMKTNEEFSAILLSDTKNMIKTKINKYAYSGGGDSIEDHKLNGGNCDKDVCFQYLRFFLADDTELNQIRENYSSGNMLTGELKKFTIDKLTGIIEDLKNKMSSVSLDTVRCFSTPKPMNFKGKVDLPPLLNSGSEEKLTAAVEIEQNLDKLSTEEQVVAEEGDIVTPWEVHGDKEKGIDYDKLIEKYGSSKILPDLILSLEECIGEKAHHFLKRGMFYSQRDMADIIGLHKLRKSSPMTDNKFFLYTGRGPSSSALHLGHMVPFIFTKWLQDKFKVPLIVQLTDDEKCLMRGISRDDVREMTIENARDIIAVGFNPRNTLVFSDFDLIDHQEPEFSVVASRIRSRVNLTTIRAIFGFSDTDSIEKVAFPATQAATSFSASFPTLFGRENTQYRSLIPCAIDQDPYFRMTRDVAPKLKLPKPALIHSKFFPALQGHGTKMNASDPNSAIFMTDTPEQIAYKIRKHTASIPEDQRSKLSPEELCHRDICFQYLTFFMEDENELERLRTGLIDGCLSEEAMKDALIGVLVPFVMEHQKRRELVTDEVLKEFMTPKLLDWNI